LPGHGFSACIGVPLSIAQASPLGLQRAVVWSLTNGKTARGKSF